MKTLKEMSLEMLKEIQEKNHFDNTKMAALLGVSAYTYTRWIKGKHWTKSPNTLNQVLKVIEEYKEVS
jgi:DNA-binding transcriptional regulator YiaG